ncbi:hypothetical protein FHS16_005182 [Paenibacillus endophyticus]|uniref:SLH domain-containing protein n=1 Tax=Paenibacillus endophyticus TaxID=1294268 RepID=A0A7W5CCC5_9BACL|nr:S-layer homology domain-containing protein [Paenibacillus endophyticus]MBB3155075.1 hypothetical protein [Paenibacillus endophyticus]
MLFLWTRPELKLLFTDINGQWHETAVQAAAEAGLVNGYPDGTFRPDATLNRQELAVILKRAAQLAGQPFASSEGGGNGHSFVDLDAADVWARQDIASAAAAGVMEGDKKNAFRPKAQTTRAEAATVLKRMLAFAGKYSG